MTPPDATAVGPQPARGTTHRTRLATAAAIAVAVLVPVRSWNQLAYAASFTLATAVLWLWGRTASRALLGGAAGPCTTVYVGELALLAFGAVASAVNHLLAAAAGRSLPLVGVVLASTAALLLLDRRRARAPAGGERLDVLPVVAAGAGALVVAIYSRHLSSAGLDTHEHTAWVEQIVRLGYVPMAEPWTRIVGDYPRTFHLLAALWAAAGLAPPSGPFVKAMPFVQNALVVLAAAESAVALAGRASDRARRRVDAAVALGCWTWMFFLVPAVYPTWDLSGTPRLASNAIVLAPAVLALAGAARGAPGLRVALAVTPLLAAWAATWNPISIVQLALAGAPLALALAWATRRSAAPPPPRRAGALLAGSCALAALVAVQDPWIASQAALRLPAAAALVRRAGLETYDGAVRSGDASPREKPFRELARTPPCGDLRCVAGAVEQSVAVAVRLQLAAARSAWKDVVALARAPSVEATRDALRAAAPIQPAPIADHAALPAVTVLLAGAVAAGAGALWRRRAGAPAATAPGAGQLLVGAVLGDAAAGIGLSLAASLAAALDDRSHEARILAGYLGFAPFHVGLAALALPFVFACAALGAAATPSPEREQGRGGGPWRLPVAVAAVAALSLVTPLNLHRPIKHRGFHSPVALADVAAFHRIEAAVPPEDGILVPAEHINVENWEHWVIPIGPTAALLPYGERRQLFDVYLGASYPLSWRDLDERLCARDPAVRARFLARHRARWILVRSPDAADAAEAARRQPFCDATVEAFGVDPVPARAERGIYLFRVAGT